MKISHEVPKCLLGKSEGFNDYQYCLVHLLEEDEDYRNHFLNYRQKEGSYIILDNSLHELGEAYNTKDLIKWCEILKPDEFIIPDAWEDFAVTTVNARNWVNIELPEGVEKVAVVQAVTKSQASSAYNIYKDLGYKKIAFSYGAEYYTSVFPHPNLNYGRALGRLKVISDLYKSNTIDKNDRVHLLGCSVPQEFGWYKGFDFIESIDTSNPVMAAVEGIEYKKWGLDKKPTANMNEHFDINESKIDLYTLNHNLNFFRKINNI